MGNSIVCTFSNSTIYNLSLSACIQEYAALLDYCLVWFSMFSITLV